MINIPGFFVDRLANLWLQARYEWRCRHVPEIREQIEQFGMRSINAIPGGWEAVYMTPAAAMIANEMAKMLDKAKAKNYLQFDFMPRLDRGMKAVRVTIQWADGESPAAKTARLEGRLKQLESAKLPVVDTAYCECGTCVTIRKQQGEIE